MRSPVSHRIWIIVFWYLQLQCFYTKTALGSTPVDEEPERLQTEVRLENLYHRILDNNEFTEMFHNAHIAGPDERPEAVRPVSQQWLPRANDGPPLSRAINHRHQINVAYSNVDDTFIPNEDGQEEPLFDRNPEAVDEPPDQISVKYAFTNERHRRAVENLDVQASTASEVPSTVGLVPLEDEAPIRSSVANGDNVSSRDAIFSPAHLDVKAKQTNGFSNAVASSPSRRSKEDRSSSELSIDDAVRAVINNVKVSNSVQPSSDGAVAKPEVMEQKSHDERYLKTLDTREGEELESASEQRSLSPEQRPSRRMTADVGAITPTHSSTTSEGVRGFILLDDSVYIAHDTQDRRSNGSSAGPNLPTLDSSIFAGRNFDEQIIFLNGPDLLETSVEQESSSSPAPELHTAPRRQMGKVARDVSQLYDAGDHHEEEPMEEPLALPLRPIVRDPAEAELAGEDNVVVLYADQREPVRLNCEVDADITTSVWLKDGQIVHATDKKSRTADVRFVRESFGGLTIRSVMMEDDGVWQCEAQNARGFLFNGRPIKLIVLDPPKEPYLLIDSRRLDAGNMFIPVKENAELTLACVSEGGNPKPALSWEVLLSPGIDRHAQKLPNDVLELQEMKKDKDKEPYKINSGAVSEAKLPGVFRVHHNARILCIMEHPTLKVRQNASILLDVQYTPSFAITRTPGFGYPLREGIEVSLKCDVDSNPPSTPLWQKDDGDTPVPQIGDGFLNFSSIRREHSGWYKCTSRHLNFQYSSIGYYLSVRYEPVDVTSEPVEQDLSLISSSSSSSSASSSSTFSASSASSSSTSNGAGPVKSSPPFGPFPVGSPIGSFKPGGQMEVELGGSVTLQCPQGSLGCWSHLDSAAVRLKGSGQTGQVSLKDVVYQDAGTYKCVGQSSGGNRKKLDPPQTPVSPEAKVSPTVIARNSTPSILPGTPLHLSVQFCANPPAYAARWLHGDRVYTPGNQYGSDVVAYGITDLPTPFCKEARLTYVHMHENVPRRFYFVVSSPSGVAEAIFRVNLTLPRKPSVSPVSPPPSTGKRGNSFSSPSSSSSSSGAANVNGGLAGYKLNTVHSVPGNGLSDTGEELHEPEEIHFPIFGTGGGGGTAQLGLPVAIASLASHWRRILHALPLLFALLLPPLLTL